MATDFKVSLVKEGAMTLLSMQSNYSVDNMELHRTLEALQAIEHHGDLGDHKPGALVVIIPWLGSM